MNKRSVKTKILWTIPSAKKRNKIQGKISIQAQATKCGSDCRSPCPCKCDDYY